MISSFCIHDILEQSTLQSLPQVTLLSLVCSCFKSFFLWPVFSTITFLLTKFLQWTLDYAQESWIIIKWISSTNYGNCVLVIICYKNNMYNNILSQDAVAQLQYILSFFSNFQSLIISKYQFYPIIELDYQTHYISLYLL